MTSKQQQAWRELMPQGRAGARPRRKQMEIRRRTESDAATFPRSLKPSPLKRLPQAASIAINSLLIFIRAPVLASFRPPFSSSLQNCIRAGAALPSDPGW